MTYQFNIQLKGITKPPVWRRVLMPDTFTFEKFHEVIQAAFGWDDSHLFGFIGKTNKDNFAISIPDDFLDKFSRQKTIDASKTKPYWRKIPTARKHRISLTGWEREKEEHGIPLVSTWKKPKPA